jgi:hypothetical protein
LFLDQKFKSSFGLSSKMSKDKAYTEADKVTTRSQTNVARGWRGGRSPDAIIKAVLDEPLIVQAGIKFFSLSIEVEEHLASQREPGCLV